MKELVFRSRLSDILKKQGLSVLEFHRRLTEAGRPVGRDSLYRLTLNTTLDQIDLRLVGKVCQQLGVRIQDLIVPSDGGAAQRRDLSPGERKKLKQLLERVRSGKLTAAQQRELKRLVDVELDMAIDNATELLRKKSPQLFDSRGRLRKRAALRFLTEAYTKKATVKCRAKRG